MTSTAFPGATDTKSPQPFELLLDSLPDGVLSFDNEGRVAWMNPSARQLFLCDANAVRGSPIARWVPALADLDALVQQAAPGTVQTVGPSGIRVPHVLGKRSDASDVDLEITLTFVDHGSAPRACLCVCRDTSAEQRLTAVQHEFVSMVSHELRTPLTSLRASLALLADSAGPSMDASLKRLLTMAQENGERLIRLVNDILDYEKLRVGGMTFDTKRHKLMPIISSALRAMEHAAQVADVRFGLHRAAATGADAESSPSSLAVQVDARRFEQVLLNLLSNAIKHSPRGGRVQLTIKPLLERVRVQVSDEGPGVPTDFVARVFEPFSQAGASEGRATSGTGLGLAISRDLMHAMSGAIGLDAPVAGRGATFWVEIPLDQAPLSTFFQSIDDDMLSVRGLL